MVCVKLLKIVVTTAVLISIWTSGSVRAVENPKEKASENKELNPSDSFLCQAQTRGFEIALGIPQHLLTAISLAESGKWDSTSKALFAWPWTVMAKG